jgi:hypothetical protein
MPLTLLVPPMTFRNLVDRHHRLPGAPFDSDAADSFIERHLVSLINPTGGVVGPLKLGEHASQTPPAERVA